MTTQLIAQGEVKIRPMEAKDSGAIFDMDRILAGGSMTIALINLISEDIKEVNSQVVGFVLARHAYIGAPAVEVCLIQGLSVHPLRQGQDIEARLVNELTDRAKSLGMKNIRVILSVSDPRMEAFFSRLNFHRAPVIVCDKEL
jgi:N-acetylglutamate synthase-like GNAT family acetyltransferase